MMNERLLLNGAPAVGFGEHRIARGGCPFSMPPEQGDLDGFGFGQAAPVAAPAVQATSPWAVALTTSVLGAATGWLIEEVARRARRRRR